MNLQLDLSQGEVIHMCASTFVGSLKADITEFYLFTKPFTKNLDVSDRLE